MVVVGVGAGVAAAVVGVAVDGALNVVLDALGVVVVVGIAVVVVC